MDLDMDRAKEIVSEFRGQRILVVGDVMLDRYVFGEAERISPEAPIPVVRVEREHEVPGGSSNVALNVKTLGGEAVLCGVAGSDLPGQQLHGLLESAGIGVDGLVRDEKRLTTVKTRVIAQRQQVVRVDRENSGRLPGDLVARLSSRARELAAAATGVVIEDYGKGVVQQEVVDAVLAVAKERGIPVGFDPKDNRELDIQGVTVATPNRRETFDAAGVRDLHADRPPLEDTALLSAGEILLDLWGPKLLLTTLGASGMLLQSKDAEPRHVPTRAREVFDVSGAGDTVVAVCVLALAAGASYYEAAELANFAAGIVVGKLGTAVATADELLDFLH